MAIVGNEEVTIVKADDKPTKPGIMEATRFIKEKLDAGVKLDEQAFQVEMVVSCGFTMKGAIRSYFNALEAMGLLLKRKDRFEQANQLLNSVNFKGESYEVVQEMVCALSEKLTATSVPQARNVVKKYLVAKGIEMPRKIRESKGVSSDMGQRGFTKEALDWAMANQDASSIEAYEFCADRNKEKQANWLIRQIRFGRSYAGLSNERWEIIRKD